jgi:carboxymethylenebutenolidase
MSMKVTLQDVTFLPGSRARDGVIARPEGEGPHPAVVLIQEWWGLDPHILAMCQKLASEGFIVLAPDLYHGEVATHPDEAEHKMLSLRMDEAVDEIAHAVAYLKMRPDVFPRKVGVVGFCMGGHLTWRAAERMGDHIQAIAPFYGGGYEPTAEDIAKIEAPVLGIWAEHDSWIPPEARNHIITLLEAANKTCEFWVASAQHAFMNDSRPRYDEGCAREGYDRLVRWFKRHLT